jgi:hypothetical protein
MLTIYAFYASEEAGTLYVRCACMDDELMAHVAALDFPPYKLIGPLTKSASTKVISHRERKVCDDAL